MKKLIAFCSIFFIWTNLFCVEFLKKASPKKNSYVLYIEPMDFGPAVSKIVLNAGKAIEGSTVDKEDFTVSVVVHSSQNFGTGLGLKKGELPVKEAYISDGAGLPAVSLSSQYITLKLKIGPDVEYSSPFASNLVFNVDELYGYKIQNENLDLSIKKRSAVVCPEATRFTTSSFTFEASENNEDIKLNYAQYIPSGSNKIPLIVFFHGIAESGSNITKPLFGIKSTALSGTKIQSHFEHGAAVLLPQCPTGWMEITETDDFGNRLWVVVDIKGIKNKISSPITGFLSKVFSVPVDETQYNVVTPVSYYSQAVKELIEKVLKENPAIDRERIYIGGCSAGGFMTVNMMIQYPQMFAAAFPVCEAFPDARISESDILKLSKKPLWFVVSKNDPVINPQKNTFATVERLRFAGAKNLHYTYFESVTDTTGELLNEEGTGPWEYSGHDVWTYVFNDMVSEGSLNLFQWLACNTNSN